MNRRETMLRLAGTVNLSGAQKLVVARMALIAVQSSGAASAASRKSEFEDVTIAGSAWDLIVAAIKALASVDTHPKDGDVKQAPLVSGAVPEGETPPCR